MAIRSQADQRRDQVYEDQFGRPWLVAIELATGDPTSHIAPAGWTDTLNVPQQFLRVPRDKYGQPKMGRLEIAFSEWRLEVERANTDWKTQLYKIGNKVYGMKFDPTTAAGDDYLMALVGPRPRPTVEELDQAARGEFPRVEDEAVPEMAPASVGPTENELISGTVRVGRPRTKG